MDYKYNDILDLNLTILRVIGYFPPYIASKTFKKRYKCYTCITYCLSLLFVGSQAVEMVLMAKEQNLKKISTICLKLFLNISYFVKLTFFIKNNKRINAIIRILTQNIVSSSSPKQDALMMIHIKYMTAFVRTYLYMVIVTGLLFAIFPLFDKNDEIDELEVGGWYPFRSSNIATILAYVYLSSEELLGGLCNASMDCIVIVCLSYICMQLGFLKDNLKHMKDICRNTFIKVCDQSSLYKKDYKGQLQKHMDDMLIQCILQYQTIIRYEHVLLSISSCISISKLIQCSIYSHTTHSRLNLNMYI